MLKIAFVNPNMHDTYPRPPLGLLSIASVCKNQGYQVAIIDANLEKLTIDQVKSRCERFDVICITAMTPAIYEAYLIADALHHKILVLGGVHASVFPFECARSDYFDVIVQGEGELTILQVLKDIETNNIKSIYKANNIQHFDDIPLPDYSLIQLNKYKARYPHSVNPPWTSVSTSRGCPYGCTFCVKAVSGSKYRAMTPDRMIDLMSVLKHEHGINDVTFYDDNFTLDKKRVQLFCEGLIRYQIRMSWTCESRVETADAELFQVMREAGCRMIYFGIESGNQGILNYLNKNISLSQIKTAIEITKDSGVKAAGYFMLGCPGETNETMNETIQFANALRLDHAQFSVCSPLPGSKLFSDYMKSGHEVPDWRRFKYLADCDKFMFDNQSLSKSEIEQAVKYANRMFTERHGNSRNNTLPE